MPPNPPLILASTSSARRALMDGLKLAYQAVPPGVSEEIQPDWTLEEAVRQLARRKALSVFEQCSEGYILGSDQLASVGGALLGKPRDRAHAKEQLSSLSGRTHRIATSVCLIGPSFERLEAEIAEVTFFDLSPEEIERYLDLLEWQGCAGGYRIEGAGQALVRDLKGDRTCVQGLPMLTTVRLLREAGFAFF